MIIINNTFKTRMLNTLTGNTPNIVLDITTLALFGEDLDPDEDTPLATFEAAEPTWDGYERQSFAFGVALLNLANRAIAEWPVTDFVRSGSTSDGSEVWGWFLGNEGFEDWIIAEQLPEAPYPVPSPGSHFPMVLRLALDHLLS